MVFRELPFDLGRPANYDFDVIHLSHPLNLSKMFVVLPICDRFAVPAGIAAIIGIAIIAGPAIIAGTMQA